MKKILFAFCTLFIISCSNDDQNDITKEANNSLIENKVTNAKNNVYTEDYINEIFSVYVKSNEFLNKRASVLEFNEDLGPLFISDDSDTKESVFQWISTNLSKTRFKNIDEANFKWTKIEQNILIENKKHPLITDFILNADIKTVEKALVKWVASPNYQASSICDSQLDHCLYIAAGNYATRSIEAFNFKTGLADLKAQTNNENKYMAEITKCSSGYKKCMGI